MIDVEIRWTDVDAFGHVHHVALVAIAEHGRSQWIDGVLHSESTWPYVVARVAFDYRSQVRFEDKVVRCRFETTNIGRSSIRLSETISTTDGRVVAEGESVIVAWDEARGVSRPLNDAEVERLRVNQAVHEQL